MCIAILNEPNKVIDFLTLQNCWDNNRDGAGMLYIEDNKLKTYKEMTSFKKFYDKYLKAREADMSKKIVLHFRISTHGKVDKTNCHPFLVDNKLGFVHNGIITGLPYSNDYSDTYMFNRHILQNMPNDFLQHKGICTLIEEFISYSKLIFLDEENNSTIIGEEKGFWDDGNWYSNSTYKYSDYYDVGGKKVAKKGNNQTSVFDSGSLSKHKYGASWLPKTTPTYLGGTYSNGVTRTFSDNEDWDTDYSTKEARNAEVFQEEDSCECCRNLADTVKFSQTYRIYCCKDCWNEYVSDSEGVWNGEVDIDGVPF
jgi:hypothetical protein